MENGNKTKFAIFCIECMQAGVVLTPREFETVYGAFAKIEGFTDEDFKDVQTDTFLKQMNQMMAVMFKRKQVQEGIMFNLITRDKIDDLAAKDDLVEYVMKAKHIATVMADEFLEPDEKMEKVIEDGRRLIEHFIDQWKNAPKKEYKEEEEATIIEE